MENIFKVNEYKICLNSWDKIKLENTVSHSYSEMKEWKINGLRNNFKTILNFSEVNQNEANMRDNIKSQN